MVCSTDYVMLWTFLQQPLLTLYIAELQLHSQPQSKNVKVTDPQIPARVVALSKSIVTLLKGYLIIPTDLVSNRNNVTFLVSQCAVVTPL